MRGSRYGKIGVRKMVPVNIIFLPPIFLYSMKDEIGKSIKPDVLKFIPPVDRATIRGRCGNFLLMRRRCVG